MLYGEKKCGNCKFYDCGICRLNNNQDIVFNNYWCENWRKAELCLNCNGPIGYTPMRMQLNISGDEFGRDDWSEIRKAFAEGLLCENCYRELDGVNLIENINT